MTTRTLSESAELISGLLARHPKLVQRERCAEVASALRSPCILLHIARFDKDRPVALDYAWNVMRTMQSDLRAGKGWSDSYRPASDQMLNQDDIRSGSKHVGTHLSYAFEGSATPEYRDFIGRRDLRTDEYAPVPDGHLEVLFAARGGAHIIEADAAIWLYYVRDYFGGTDAARERRSGKPE